MNPLDDPILVRLRMSLQKTYGDKIERVALFGARAPELAAIERVLAGS